MFNKLQYFIMDMAVKCDMYICRGGKTGTCVGDNNMCSQQT